MSAPSSLRALTRVDDLAGPTAAVTLAAVGAAPVQVTCYPCRQVLYAGDEVPDGGADAVFAAAGCTASPPSCPGRAPAEPPPAEPAGAEAGELTGLLALTAACAAQTRQQLVDELGDAATTAGGPLIPAP